VLGNPIRSSEAKWLARAATATHHLRDIDEDLGLRYCNIPQEAILQYRLDPKRLGSAQRAGYVVERAAEILQWFVKGQRALPLIKPFSARLLFWLFGFLYRRLLLKIERQATALQS